MGGHDDASLRPCGYGTAVPTPRPRVAFAYHSGGGWGWVLDELLGTLADLVADRVAMRLASPRRNPKDEWLDTRRAAEYVGIHRDSLRRLAAERAIPTEQAAAGCKLYFKRADLDSWPCTGPASLAPMGGELMAEPSGAPRRVRVERGIYRRPTGVLEVGFKDEIGRQRWRTVDGGVLAARKVRDDLAARRGRGESVAPKPKLRLGEAAETVGWTGRSRASGKRRGQAARR